MKRLHTNKLGWIYLFCTLLLLLSLVLGLFLGATRIRPDELLGALLGDAEDQTAARILYYVRLPRVLASLLCGAALALSGTVIQGVLANRLASPSIIGVNAGAGLAVTICSALGILGGWRLSLFSFLGAFLTVMLVSLGAKKWGASRGTVILMGVALNALLGAISDTVTTFAPSVAVMSNDFKIGDFSFVTYSRLLPAAIIILTSILLLLTLSKELDLLSLGDETARGLGLNAGVMRVIFLLLAALLAGAAVSLAGLLSFVGLLVPAAVRRLAGTDSFHVMALSVLLGAGFVTLCDTVARVAFAPYELPVGIILAFLGAPFFLFLLIKRKGGHRHA